MQHPKSRKRDLPKADAGGKTGTKCEKLLWERLKPSTSFQFNVKRQHLLLDQYVVSFFCTDPAVAFEIVGKEKAEEDLEQRLADFDANGITLVQMPEHQVMRNLNDAADFILDICRGHRTVDELDEDLR